MSLRPPIAFWTLPSTLSALPSDSSLASPVALPTVSLIEPLISFTAPAIRFLFMSTSPTVHVNSVHHRDDTRTTSGCGRLGKYLAFGIPAATVLRLTAGYWSRVGSLIGFAGRPFMTNVLFRVELSSF